MNPGPLFPCSFVATDGERSFSAAHESGQHSPPLDHPEESFPAAIPAAGDLYDCSQGASVYSAFKGGGGPSESLSPEDIASKEQHLCDVKCVI